MANRLLICMAVMRFRVQICSRQICRQHKRGIGAYPERYSQIARRVIGREEHREVNKTLQTGLMRINISGCREISMSY